MLLLLLAISLLIASPAWAAIVCENETATSTVADPQTLNYTPGAGTNRVLIVNVHYRDTDADNTTISGVTSTAGGTFNHYGTASSVGGGADLVGAMYYSTDFADGVQTISVDYSGSVLQGYVAAFVCTGVNTADPFRDTAATATGTTTTATVNVTGTSTLDLVIDNATIGTLDAGVSPTLGADQTQMYNVNLGGDNAEAVASSEPGNGGTVTMSWTNLTGINSWSIVAGALVEATSTRRSSAPVMFP